MSKWEMSIDGSRCPDCGTVCEQKLLEGLYRCPNCRKIWDVIDDEFQSYNAQVFDTDVEYDLDDDEDDNTADDIPEGCAACGGPYPDCCSSCSLFDF